MNKLPILGAVILLLLAISPASTKVRNFFVQAETGSEVVVETEGNMNEEGIIEVDTTADESSPTPTPTTGSANEVFEEKIEKTENGVHYEGTVQGSSTEHHSDVTENGTRTVTNKNSVNSKTNINVECDTGGNEGSNVTNGDCNSSIKVTNNGKTTKIEYP